MGPRQSGVSRNTSTGLNRIGGLEPDLATHKSKPINNSGDDDEEYNLHGAEVRHATGQFNFEEDEEIKNSRDDQELLVHNENVTTDETPKRKSVVSRSNTNLSASQKYINKVSSSYGDLSRAVKNTKRSTTSLKSPLLK